MTDGQQYKCDVCAAGFATQEELEEHGRQEHDALTEALVCPVCGAALHDQASLDTHTRQAHYTP